jgi:hypothetical protein
MKTPIVLGFLLLLMTSCNPIQSPDQGSSSLSGGSPSGGGQPVDQAMAPRLVRVMNYNQFNMTLSKLTGINQSKVMSVFEQIKGSLPADGDIEGMTSFNIVAKAKLADAYCGLYINGETNAQGALIAGGVPRLADSEIPGIKMHLLNKFIDYDAADPVFESLSAELDNVLLNKDGQGGSLIGATLSASQLNRNLSVMACVVILASSHITLLE